MDPKKRNWYLVLGGIAAYTLIVGGLSLALAIRNSENAADFIFKWFGAGMAFLFASAGPFGLVGLALMSGRLTGTPVKAALAFAAFLSFVLILYVGSVFDVPSLFR